MFVSQKTFDEFSSKVTMMLSLIQMDLGKKRCDENACKCCEHGTVVSMPDGTAKTVCGKNMKAQCADFTPRSFGEVALWHSKE